MKRITLLKGLLIMVAAAIMFTACGKGNGGSTTTPTVTEAPKDSATPVPTDTPTPEPTATATPTPTPVVYLDTLGINGVAADNESVHGITHFLSMVTDPEKDDTLYTEVQFALDGHGKVAFVYGKQPLEAMSEGYGSASYYIAFGALEGGRVRIDKTEYLGDFESCWIVERYGTVLVTKQVMGEDRESRRYIQFFDFDGNEQTGGPLKEESVSGAVYLSGNNDYYYESDYKARAFRKVNLITGEKTNVDYSHQLLMESFYGISHIKGVDYICGSFMGVDLKMYEGVINAETGEPLFLARNEDIGYLNCENNQITFNSRYSEEDGIYSTIFNGDKLITIHQNNFYESYFFLGDRLLVTHIEYDTHEESFEFDDGSEFSYTVTDGCTAEVALVSIRDGEVLYSNTVTVMGEKDFAGAYCYSDNEIVLLFTDMAGNLDFFLWETDGKYSAYDFTEAVRIEISDFTGFTIPDLGYRYVREDLVPGVCPAELSEERAYADELEKKYDIKIYIADEAKCLMGGYVFEALNNKTVLRSCLETMDREFGKYPAGFFSLYKKLENYPDGLEIFFTGGLIGYEDGNLDKAGGLRTEDENSINIALDGYDGRYEAAVHHEISHSIEVLIRELGSEQLDEDVWNDINVSYSGHDGFYAHSYSHQDSEWLYGYKDNYKYTYESWEWYPNKYDRVLFIDDYSMTYPTEDRSRLFEKIMWDELDVSKYPALYKKTQYYVRLIRKMMMENGIPAEEKGYWEWVFTIEAEENQQ